MQEGNLIDGRAIAAQIQGELTQRLAALKSQGITAGLAFVRVGEDAASKAYVGRKQKVCAELGILSGTQVMPERTSEAELLAVIARLNSDRRMHGILVQAPLPRQIRQEVIYAAVLPQKDVDGFHPINAGKLMLGDATGFQPCTPAGIRELLVRSNVKTDGAEVVVLGRGNNGTRVISPDEELSRVRETKLSSASRLSGSATYAVAFSRGRVDEVSYISGDSSLKFIADRLASTKFHIEFPGQDPVKLVRRGILMCGTTGCDFVMLLPADAAAQAQPASR